MKGIEYFNSVFQAFAVATILGLAPCLLSAAPPAATKSDSPSPDRQGVATPFQSAKWIWIPKPEEGYQRNQYIFARREFSLESACETATLYISADTIYHVQVNGRALGYGPPPSDPRHIAHDTHDISKLLRPGRNVIAVVVNTVLSPRGGLICQIEGVQNGARKTLLVTDDQWRVSLARAWHWNTPPATLWFNFSEVRDNRLIPKGWAACGFDDSKWQTPSLAEPQLTEEQPSAGADQRNAASRVIEPSGLPALTQSKRRPLRIVRKGQVVDTEDAYRPRAGRRFDVAWKMLGEFVHPLDKCSIENAEALTRDNGEAAVVSEPIITREQYYRWWEAHDEMPKVEQATLILEFDHLAGRLEIDIDANAGAVLDVAWGELLIDGRVHPKTHPAWDTTRAHRYTLREGRQVVEMYHWEVFRYVQITFRYLSRPARIHGIAANQVHYPFDFQQRYFHSSDPRAQTLWNAWENTVRSTVIDYCTDPREKGFWLVPGMPTGLLATYGDLPLIRRQLRIWLRSQRGEGPWTTVSPYGGSVWLYTNVGFAKLVQDYFWYGTDRDLFDKSLYPWLERFLKVLDSYSSPDGLMDVRRLPKATLFADWSRPGATNMLVWNLEWALLLTESARIADCLGQHDEAQAYRQRADQLREVIYQRFWVDEKGLYVDELLDAKPGQAFSEIGNALALSAGLGRGGRAQRILTALRERTPVLFRSEPIGFTTVILGMFHAGKPDDAMSLFSERCSRHFRTGNTLMGEEWSYYGSLRNGAYLIARIRNVAQGVDSVCLPVVFLRELLGVKATARGMSEFVVRPQLGSLKDAEAKFASPRGDIFVKAEKSPSAFTLQLTVPGGSRAAVFLPKGKDRRVNGKPLDQVAGVEEGKQTPEGESVAHVVSGEYEFVVTY